nr:MAG TPA: hypothetical protein [Herelleviridae sp.]
MVRSVMMYLFVDAMAKYCTVIIYNFTPIML